MRKSVNKNKKITTKHKLVIVAAVVLLLIATPFAIYAVNKWLDARDYERFMTVKNDVEEIERRLGDALPEMNWNLEPTCSRAHLTFGDGDAGCDVRTTGFVIATNPDEVIRLSNAFDEVITNSHDLLRERRKGEENPANFMINLEEGFTGAGFTNIQTGMNCSSYKEIAVDTTKTFSLSFACHDNSRDTWFPRSDR